MPGNNSSSPASAEEEKNPHKRLSNDRTEFFESIKNNVGDSEMLKDIEEVEKQVKEYGTLLMEYMGNEFLVEVLNALPKQGVLDTKGLNELLNTRKTEVANLILGIENKIFQNFSESKNRFIIYFQNPHDPYSGKAVLYTVLQDITKSALKIIDKKANNARYEYDQRAAKGIGISTSQAQSYTCVGSMFKWFGEFTGLNKRWPFNRYLRNLESIK